MVGNEAREDEVDGSEEFEGASEEDAFLAFSEGRSTEGALDDLLVGAPVEEVEEGDSGEEGSKGDFGS